jgi:chromosome segregation ATPase
VDHQRIPSPDNTPSFEELADRCRELLDSGENALREWRSELDTMSQQPHASSEAVSENSLVCFEDKSNSASLAVELQDSKQDLELLQSQLEQIQEELEFYFARYQAKDKECELMTQELEKLSAQQAWLLTHIKRQSALMQRVMVSIAQLNA